MLAQAIGKTTTRALQTVCTLATVIDRPFQSIATPPIALSLFSVKIMDLQELKQKTPGDLLAFAEELEIEGASNLRMQDMMFGILKALAESGVPIHGGGVLEVSCGVAGEERFDPVREEGEFLNQGHVLFRSAGYEVDSRHQ